MIITPRVVRLLGLVSVVLALVTLSARAGFAQGRTDIVVLANGDRITGEITSLSRGRLEFKTDDAGTIAIEWEHVSRIQSTRQFEVSLSDGRLLVGSFAASTARVVVLAGLAGTDILPMPDVTQITPIGASFWARLEGSFDAGFSYTHSSGIGQVNLNGDVRYRKPAFSVRLKGSSTLTYQEDESDPDDRGATELSYSRYRGDSWFVVGAARFENNESLGLVLRSQVGGAIGRRLVNSNRAHVEVGAGLVGNDERAVDAEATQNLEGLLVFQASYYSYDSPQTNLDATVQYYPSLSSWNRQRLQVDGNLRREVWKDFFVSLNGFITFDSKPPNPEASRSDTGVSFSAGWSF